MILMSNKPNRAGPFLGAAIIGCGIGYLIYNKTGNAAYGIAAALVITSGDYFLVMVTNKFFKKDK